MQHAPTGVLLLQLGTPDSPSTSDVRRYLREFLMDYRVIDIPWLGRQLLVNGIIANFRAPKSAKLYREIWTEQGSPLLIYGQAVEKALQQQLGPEYLVKLGMRYQKPPLRDALLEMKKAQVKHLILVPLFPQNASSSTGSALEAAFKEIGSWQFIPEVSALSSYFNHPEFIQLWADKGRKAQPETYDHILFTFHGVPWRHIRKSGCEAQCQHGPSPCPEIDASHHICYRAQCFASARAVVKALQIPEHKYTICFQSRLGRDPWLTPYTDYTLEHRAKQGDKRILVFSMAFVADCLETIHEVGTEYHELFREKGGDAVHLIPSLNDDPEWIAFLAKMVKSKAIH